MVIRISKTGKKYKITNNTTMAQVDIEIKNRIRYIKHLERTRQKKHLAERDIIRMALDKVWPEAIGKELLPPGRRNQNED